MSTVSEIQTARVAEAFDSVAPTFEESLENDITRALREKVYITIDSLIRPGSSILDINCGIGIDAVELARKGYKVVGIDLSPKMVDEARSRGARQGVKATFRQSSFESLTSVIGEQFDLVLSNFGGLNCVDSLERVAPQVASVTKPGGHFVAIVMPRVSLWEVVGGLARLDLSWAFRRLKRNVKATGFNGKTFIVHYYSSRKLISAFEPWYRVKGIRGFNIFSPPPHANLFQQHYPLLSYLLVEVNEKTSSFPIIRSLGDHYMAIFKRDA